MDDECCFAGNAVLSVNSMVYAESLWPETRHFVGVFFAKLCGALSARNGWNGVGDWAMLGPRPVWG